MDDLRARVREGMEHEKKHQAEHSIKEELLQQLTDKFPIDVPTLLVENVDRPAAGARLALADRAGTAGRRHQAHGSEQAARRASARARCATFGPTCCWKRLPSWKALT